MIDNGENIKVTQEYHCGNNLCGPRALSEIWKMQTLRKAIQDRIQPQTAVLPRTTASQQQPM